MAAPFIQDDSGWHPLQDKLTPGRCLLLENEYMFPFPGPPDGAFPACF